MEPKGACSVCAGEGRLPAREGRLSALLSGCRVKATCAWKGEATMYNVVAHGETSKDAAWCYQEPTPAARNIKGYVAFGKRILVKKTFLSPSK